MILKYILDHWKKLISTYLIGASVLFGIFYVIGLNQEPVYRSTFTLNPKGNSLQVAHAVDNLFGMLLLKDSITFANRLEFTQDQVRRINSTEHDILNGDFIEIEVVAKDVDIIYPFYNSLISYLNSDSILNIDNIFARKRLEIEMKVIDGEILSLDSTGQLSKESYWQFSSGTSELEPMVGSSSSMNRVFLMNRLNNLAIQHHKLVNVQPMSKPIIPIRPEKVRFLVYFIFTNIIVLSLMFIQYLMYNSRQQES